MLMLGDAEMHAFLALSLPVLPYSQLHPYKQTSVKIKIFFQENASNYHLQIVSRFVHA